MQAEDMPEVFEIVNREADLTMNRVVVMIKDMGMQDQVSLFVPNEKTYPVFRYLISFGAYQQHR